MLEIPGAAKGNTRLANIAVYQMHLVKTFQEGGDESVRFWRDLNDAGDDKRKEDE